MTCHLYCVNQVDIERVIASYKITQSDSNTMGFVYLLYMAEGGGGTCNNTCGSHDPGQIRLGCLAEYRA